MGRVTNEQLAGLMDEWFKEVRKDLKDMNGRQRGDHDRVGVLEGDMKTVKENQDKCPVLQGRWNLNDPKVFVGTTVTTIVSVVGLMALVERLAG